MAYQCLSDKPLLTLFFSSLSPVALLNVNAGEVALSLENRFFRLVCRTFFGVCKSSKAYVCVLPTVLLSLSALIFQLKSKCNLKVAFTMGIYGQSNLSRIPPIVFF